MVDRVSVKLVSGDPPVPEQVTEVWTFVRRAGGAPGDWKFAIQQVSCLAVVTRRAVRDYLRQQKADF